MTCATITKQPSISSDCCIFNRLLFLCPALVLPVAAFCAVVAFGLVPVCVFLVPFLAAGGVADCGDVLRAVELLLAVVVAAAIELASCAVLFVVAAAAY